MEGTWGEGSCLEAVVVVAVGVVKDDGGDGGVRESESGSVFVVVVVMAMMEMNVFGMDKTLVLGDSKQTHRRLLSTFLWRPSLHPSSNYFQQHSRSGSRGGLTVQDHPRA